jgi:hypothetical protein
MAGLSDNNFIHDGHCYPRQVYPCVNGLCICVFVFYHVNLCTMCELVA